MGLEPSEVLNGARKAFAEKDYEDALEKYEWFFENSTSIDSSYHGVRLSYCLGEWAELAKVYPPAEHKLLKLKQIALANFDSTKSINSFNDYANICGYLDCTDESIDQFLKIHKTNTELAKKIFRYIYEPLARMEKWGICREYMGNGYKRYEEILEIFDYCIKHSKEKDGDIGREIEEDGVKHTKEELLWILKMLSHTNDVEEYESAMKRIKSDLERRGYTDMYQEIINNAPKPTQ